MCHTGRGIRYLLCVPASWLQICLLLASWPKEDASGVASSPARLLHSGMLLLSWNGPTALFHLLDASISSACVALAVCALNHLCFPISIPHLPAFVLSVSSLEVKNYFLKSIWLKQSIKAT